MLIENAIIKSVSIKNDDHGLLTAWIDLEYNRGRQSFGGYALYLPDSFKHSKDLGNYAGHFIWRCMEVADVHEWGKMVGKTIRVAREDKFDTIKAIGHIIKEIWFYPEQEFKAISKGSYEHKA